jgi:hypothetical protein
MFTSPCVNKHGKCMPVKVGHAKLPNVGFPDFAYVIGFDVPLLQTLFIPCKLLLG